jgi:hypothetical protein
MLSHTDIESLQTFAEKGTQTRMDARLARRAELRHLAHSPRAELPITRQEYVMEPLALKASLAVSEPSIEDETATIPRLLDDDSHHDCEDDAWLNDRALPQLEAVLRESIQEEYSAGNTVLTCWF